jgi:hypothetical protein
MNLSKIIFTQAKYHDLLDEKSGRKIDSTNDPEHDL